MTSPNRSRVRRAGVTLLAVVAACALIAGCTASHPHHARPSTARAATSGTGTAAGTPAPAPPPSTGAGLAQVPQVAAELSPSVVTILVHGGNGSGVIFTRDGLILTNEHVVRGNTDVQVEFADGRRFAGKVTATDPITDLALVKVDRNNLPAAHFDTALPTVGSLAVVIGSPLGFQNTVTAGVISGLHRSIPGSATEGQSLVDLIQTDAPISPGNSGGALANAAGKVIGISEAYIPPSAGAVALGFAIPAGTVVDIAKQLEANGKARHAFAGFTPAAITPEIASELQLASTDGVIVAAVASGGPAAHAGLQPGDIVTAVDGKRMHSPEYFIAALRPRRAGDVLALSVQRPGRGAITLKLTLSDRPD